MYSFPAPEVFGKRGEEGAEAATTRSPPCTPSASRVATRRADSGVPTAQALWKAIAPQLTQPFDPSLWKHTESQQIQR